jgi:hypothetical protein
MNLLGLFREAWSNLFRERDSDQIRFAKQIIPLVTDRAARIVFDELAKLDEHGKFLSSDLLSLQVATSLEPDVIQRALDTLRDVGLANVASSGQFSLYYLTLEGTRIQKSLGKFPTPVAEQSSAELKL